MSDQGLSNEGKTLEDVIGEGIDPNNPPIEFSLSVESRRLLAAVMMSAGLSELRIKDEHVLSRAQIKVGRDIFTQELIIQLVGNPAVGRTL